MTSKKSFKVSVFFGHNCQQKITQH